MRTTILIALLLAGLPSAARADEPEAKTRTVLVSGEAGQFTLVTSPRFVSTIYLPSDVKRVLASDQDAFTVRSLGDAGSGCAQIAAMTN